MADAPIDPDESADPLDETDAEAVEKNADMPKADIPDDIDHTPAGDDDARERPTTEESTLGALGAKLITSIPKPLLGVRGTLFKRMAVKSIENYHKAAGGDAIAINAKAGQQITLEPVAYMTPAECEEGQRPGWRVKGREKAWNPAKEGNSVNYLGRTPVVALEDDAHVEAGWLAPRIGQAVEMDNYWPLFTDPDIVAHIDYGARGAATNGAVADGGQASIQFDLEDMGQYAEDAIVDLGSGPGYDGMRISMAKAREWQAETTSSEEMQMQEERGRLMGLLDGQDGPSLTKLLLISAGIILGVLGIVLLGPELVGGGGGAASGINPLMLLGGL